MLDLDAIDKLDLTKDADKIGKMVDEAYKANNAYIDSLARLWEQNIRFYEGDQWIYYNEFSRNYERIPETKYTKFIPRPITNLLLPVEQTITSLLTKNKSAISVSANSDNELDVIGAKTGERVIDAKWEIDDETLNYMKAAKIMQLCGTVFREDSWNPTKGRVQILQTMEGEATVADGDTEVKIWTPFEVIPDKESQSWFIKGTMEPTWWIKWAYGREGNGYTGKAATVKEDKDFSLALNIRYRLKESSGIMGSRGTDAASSLKGYAVLKTAYIKPTLNHKKGIMVVTANGRTLYCGDSPYFEDILDDSWHPFSWAFWEMNPFRFHGLSLFENLVPLQRRINSIDSLIILNRMLNVSPQWVNPKGSGIPEGYFSGRPGLVLNPNPVGANGMLPQRMPGISLAADVWKERQDLVSEMHMIAGDNEVMNGNRPDGVNTLGGLNLLLEQSYSKFSPMIQSWERFQEKSQQKKLLLIARRYRQERPKFTKKLQAVNSGNMDLELTSFTGMILRDNIDIKIEAGSSLPKSKAMHQNNILQLQDRGLLGDCSPQGNPIANQAILDEFGVTTFDSQNNADVKKARYNVALLKSINEQRMGMDKFPILMPYDDLMIHKKVVEDAMKVPGFKDAAGVFNKFYATLMNEVQNKMAPPPPPMPSQGAPNAGPMPPPQNIQSPSLAGPPPM